MSVLFGGRGKGPTRINDLAIQTSSQGVALTKGWGTGRCKVNLFWYGGFRSVTKKEKAGGKGAPKTTTYQYFADVMMGFASGPVTAVLTCYKDKQTLSPGAAGLSIALGTIGQSVWGHLTTNYPTQALAYSGIAYAYAANYALTDSASLSNHSFEVQFPVKVSGKPDANPALILTDMLENTYTGVRGWQTGLLGSLTDYSDYCLANGLLLSPILESQTKASDFIESDLMEATNSFVFWSEGLLKVKPLGDTAATGNSVTWTPNLTPVYDFTEDDFLSSPKLEILDQTDAYNRVEIEYLDRANQYNTAVEPAFDLDNIIEYKERKEDTKALHSICDKTVAVKVANLRLQRLLYIRKRWSFTVPDSYILLEQGDIVTLSTTTDGMLLDRLPVRILEIQEEGENGLQMLAEVLVSRTASAATYNTHPSEGYVVDTSAAGGPVTNPVLVNAPLQLTDNVPEVWIAASSSNPLWGGCEVWASSDDVDYTYIGRIEQPARYGALTNTLASAADPSPSGTFNVNLSDSRAVLGSVTDTARDVGATLTLIDKELISYRDVLLTTTFNYTISNLRRGLYGTTPAAHTSGAKMTRLDDDMFKVPYDKLGLGTVAYFKFLSYNLWGLALEDISTATAYSTSLIPLNSGVFDFGSYSLVVSPNLYFDDGMIKKIGNTTAWNEQAYSNRGYTSAAEVSWRVTGGGAVVVGLNTDPVTNASWTSIDYGISVNAAANTWTSVVSGSPDSTGSVTIGDILSISYKGTSITLRKNGTVIQTISTSAGQTFFLDSSFESVGSSIGSLVFIAPGIDGNAGAPGATGPTGATLYTWYAYADSLDGTFNFTAGVPGNRTYQGVAYNKTTATESTTPSDYTWSPYIGPPNFGLAVFDSKTILSANKLIKVSSNGVWDGSIHSTESFKGGASVSFVVDDAAKNFMVGLNTDPTTDGSYSSIDFSVYVAGASGIVYAWEGAGNVSPIMPAAVVGDVFSVTYNNKTVVYSKNGIPFWVNTTVAEGLTLFLDTSMLHVGQSGRILSFTGVGSEGSSGFTLVNIADVTITSPTSVKHTGGSNSWTAVAASRDWYPAVTASIRAKSGQHITFGLTTSAVSGGATTVDYAFHATNAGVLYVMRDFVTQYTGTYADGDVLTINADGNKVKYLKNGAVVHSHDPNAANELLRASFCPFYVGDVIEGIAVAPGGGAGISPVLATASPTAKQFSADADGTIKSGQLPFNIVISATKAGATIGGTTNIIAVSGATATAVSDGFTVDTVTADSAYVSWRFTASDGQIVDNRVTLSRLRDPTGGGEVLVNYSSTSWWGSGSYGSTGPTCVLSASATGKLRLTGFASFFSATNGSATIVGKLQYRAVGSGTWIDAGISGTGVATRTIGVPGEPNDNTAGVINITGIVTGLVANGSYEMQLVGSRTGNAVSSATGYVAMKQEV